MGLRQCEPDRNAGRPLPAWWPTIKLLLDRNRRYFPPGLPDEFLGAWIEKESDGRHDLVSKLGEVGYFQLHPDEIRDHFGKDPREVAAEVRSSRNASVRWGGRLITVYDRELRRIGVPRHGDFYLGMLKAMHWSPWARIWAQHAHHALGRWPRSYTEFDLTTQRIASGELPYDPNLRHPPKIPSCSPIQMMSRMHVFPKSNPHRGLVVLNLWPTNLPVFAFIPMPSSPVPTALLGASLPFMPMATTSSFPGLSFSKPVPGAVTSVWWDHRDGLRGHEGVDIPLREGDWVRSVAGGKVWHAGRSADPKAGVWVGVQHAAGWASRYMHLKAVSVKPGDIVSKGQVIGAGGSTGAQSGPHLHFSLLLDESRLPEYTAHYGAPRDGYGRDHGRGVAVPAEPVIAFDGYTLKAFERAVSRGVYPRAKPSKAPWVAGTVAALATAYGIYRAARTS